MEHVASVSGRSLLAWLGRPGSAASRRVQPGRRRSVREWHLEPLEGRVLLATIPVTTLADAGAGSLREAIQQANMLAGPDTISFGPAVRGTIELLSALPNLASAITLEGPGAEALTVARNSAPGTPEFRIFTVPTGPGVAISGLTITGGRTELGGGIFNSGTLTVTASTLAGNSASIGGGGIYHNLGTLTVTASTLSGNRTSFFGNGGGIAGSGGTLTVTASTLSGNSAAFFGGGISSGGTLTVTASTLSGNSAGFDGGGISSTGTLTVTASTLSGNSAENVGGGIANSGGMVTVTASTLSGNSAENFGGGIASGTFGAPATLTVHTSLFANGPGGNLANLERSTITSLGHNLFTDAPTVPLAPTDLVDTDPLLAPLGDYGGPTATHALLPSSPAIDAGADVPRLTTDQRGVPRPQGPAPDIGAFESRGFVLSAVSGSGQQAEPGAPFPSPLVVAVASPFGEPVTGGRVTFIAPPDGASATLIGNPATIGLDGRAAVSATANSLGGPYAVTARTTGASTGVAFPLTNLSPSIGLAPVAGTNPVGQPHTVTATVTAVGGAPLAGVPVVFQVVAGPNAGVTGVLSPADGRTDAAGRVSFTYVGAGGPGTDTIVATATLPGGAALASPPVTTTWTAAPVAPTVLSLRRLGFHHRPTRLVLAFSAPLDPARAQDPTNYRLTAVGPHHARPIPLRAATYDDAGPTVTLLPARRLAPQGTYRLVINARPPGGLASPAGVPLDGDGDGQPGGDFVASFVGRPGPLHSRPVAPLWPRSPWAVLATRRVLS